MKDTIKYVGLDVSKEKIAVAIAEEGRENPRRLTALPRKASHPPQPQPTAQTSKLCLQEKGAILKYKPSSLNSISN
ncbi:hypothetical protein VKA52_10545 [Halobacillus sp. HZG1]|uniref:hypothetical protein n=1 Tax=Halobacillus sp. HZG1 TaxID=3111769 RepID=UPI002DBF1FAD|nr:hypothetical protein [Halobacillus sp. HZG1]MEC3884164.1 hypothetical protein [Halobacillus sp. HZG1]